MDNSLKGLILAAGVVITCIVIGLGFYLSREAKNTSNSGANQVSGMNSEYQDVNLALYDGLKVSGSEVINLINKSKSDAVFISVKTKASTATNGVFYINAFDADGKLTSAGLYDPATATAVNKINETARFKGTVQKDASDVLQGIYFVQQ